MKFGGTKRNKMNISESTRLMLKVAIVLGVPWCDRSKFSTPGAPAATAILINNKPTAR